MGHESLVLDEEILTKYTENSESNLMRCLQLLASSKQCGLLMLINKLLTEPTKNLTQRSSKASYNLADKLLYDFYRIRIDLSPSLKDKPLEFVLSFVIQAKRMALHSKNCENVSLIAERFLQQLEACQTNQEAENLLNNLEKSWQDFAVHLLREKLSQVVNLSKSML